MADLLHGGYLDALQGYEMKRVVLILCLMVLVGCKPESPCNQAAVTDIDITDDNSFHVDRSGQACGLTTRDIADGHVCIVIESP